MKKVIAVVGIAFLLILSPAADSQDKQPERLQSILPGSTPRVAGMSVLAESIRSVGPVNRRVVYLKGNVEVHALGFILFADEAVYDVTTGEIKPHGNVIVKQAPGVYPARPTTADALR